MTGRATLVAALVGLAALASGCGVGTQATAQRIDPGSVPYHLLSPASTAPTPAPTGSGSTRLMVYFEGPDGLVAVVRLVGPSPTVPIALAQLDKGPLSTEGGGQLQSPVSSATPVAFKRVEGKVAYVSVPKAFTQLGGQDQIVAAAQIVYTLTALSGISSVVLSVDGQAAQVPISGGTLKEGPLSRADYTGLLAP